MNAYTILLGLLALLLLNSARLERAHNNLRDAAALAWCATGLGALAATFTLFA